MPATLFLALSGFNYRVCELLVKRGIGIDFRNFEFADQPALASGRNLIYPSNAMSSVPTEFSEVAVTAKANIYFDGKVVSHSILLADGSRKTLGLIYPGEFYFGTEKAERMEVVAGECVVKLKDSDSEVAYSEGEFFDVPADSGFDIAVAEGIFEYICSFLD